MLTMFRKESNLVVVPGTPPSSEDESPLNATQIIENSEDDNDQSSEPENDYAYSLENYSDEEITAPTPTTLLNQHIQQGNHSVFQANALPSHAPLADEPYTPTAPLIDHSPS